MKQLFHIPPAKNGDGTVIFAWQQQGNYLATAGENRRVQLWDRRGQLKYQFPLENNGSPVILEWDHDGDVLAVLQQGASTVTLWSLHTQKTEELDLRTKEISFIGWAKNGPQLAIGTAKGALVIYNRKTRSTIPVKGKHSKRIISGCWNKNGLLALGGEDKLITISDVHGDSIDQKSTKHDPQQLVFNTAKQTGTASNTLPETTLSANAGQVLWLYDYAKKDDKRPLELAFQTKYGRIKSYKWFGDGYVMLGFSLGFVVIVSTHLEEIGNEVNACQLHDDQLSDITYNDAIKMGASVGNNMVKVFNMDMSHLSDFDESQADRFELEDEYGSLDRVQWTEDGQILTVSSRSGSIYTFLTSIPVLNDSHGSRVLYLTSLSELCIKDIVTDQVIARFEIGIEPSFVCLGPRFAAVGLNNSVSFYKYAKGTGKFLGDKSYKGNVQSVKIGNSYAAILHSGSISLQLIEFREELQDRKEKFFPEEAIEDIEVTSMALTNDFLIYSTNRGNIVYFSLQDWTVVNNFRFEVGVSHVFPNSIGTRIIFIDETHAAYLYNPVDDQVTPVEKFSGSADKVLWDISDPNVFVTSDPKKFTTYIYSPQTTKGPAVRAIRQVANSSLVASTERPDGFLPILLHDGRVICQIPSGSIASVLLNSHSTLKTNNTTIAEQKFYQLLYLNRFRDAYHHCNFLDSEPLWKELAEASMEHLDLTTAVLAYRKLRDPAMVMSLQRLEFVDELNVLLGHIAMLRQSFSEAESRFLKSSQRIKALEMRRDLMHWDRALRLAEQLDQKQIPIVSREYAHQLELRGEYSSANELYQKALNNQYTQGRPLPARHVSLCKEGIARTTIRLGNFTEGKKMALESNNIKLCRECAQVFEELKQFSDAAPLYERAKMYEKAAEIYIYTKNYRAVEPLLSQLKNPKLFISFAKAKESERKYQEAESAYERANDYLSVVRLNLTKLSNPSKAIEIVKNNKSVEGAALIANYCKENKNYRRAIEFLVLAGNNQEAFVIAQQHNEMETYSAVISSAGGPSGVPQSQQDFRRIARHYESKGEFGKAGDYYRKCSEYEKAMSLYLKCGDSKLESAIEVVGLAENENLTRRLVEHLMGDVDGVPKDPHFIFKLYMVLGNYEQAAKTALLIAKQEQQMGNYAIAKSILLDTHQELLAKNVHIPSELRQNLMLLQSYIVIKDLTKLGEPELAARLLVRVAKNISRFPNHNVPILTTTVIMCYRAGLKKQAFQYASVLVQPEFRQRIEANYKKLIFGIIRKKRSEEEPDEELTPCPYCSFKLPATELNCSSCKNEIPYCIVTGRHMVADDWSMCPKCKFPALCSKYTKLLGLNDSTCPMCDEKVQVGEVMRVRDVRPILQREKERKSGGELSAPPA
eukprot:CAMPEP_0117447486 /NCGR_PEP_ID=MMETSP0759-20121206/6902_1 /TAXON_ID=63605 /ORGANISM="Percolomonas cosmopolitus, Strain WS" /LENGTH=1376 /DNA_ID=CAMNT_0005239827 /DNA_START=113 /DNA_END=4243 /DNA_ORIENTATION=+